MSKTILVDARYYASIIRQTRKRLRICHADMARMLEMPRKEYLDCELGRRLFPEPALMRMMHFACLGLMVRYSVNNKKRKKE